MKQSLTLTGLCLLFLLAFFVQRSRSAVLTIEGERPRAERIAGRTEMTVAEVMSLRELLGPDLTDTQLIEAAARFSLLRNEMSEELAILTVGGYEDLAMTLWRDAGQDPKQAALLLRSHPENIVPTRFSSMTDRFAGRLPR